MKEAYWIGWHTTSHTQQFRSFCAFGNARPELASENRRVTPTKDLVKTITNDISENVMGKISEIIVATATSEQRPKGVIWNWDDVFFDVETLQGRPIEGFF